jgi:SanA protein
MTIVPSGDLMKKIPLRPLVIVLTLILTIPALVCALRVWVHARAAGRIHASIGNVPPTPVALVLGAGLWGDGSPTPALYDRVATAVDLYKTGKVQKLLMSGDNRFVNYDEPGAMKALAVQLGVPAEDIVPDYAGRRTYDSCYRAKEIFGVQQAIIVTQRFHLDRALFLCDALGVKSVGVAADRRTYPPYRWWELREVLATAAAWWDVNVRHPVPVLGEKLPIQVSAETQRR